MSTEQQLSAPAIVEPDLLDTPSAGPKAIRGSLLRVLGYGLGALFSLVSVPLLIRHLGFGEYGRYVTVISLVTIVQGVTDVGLGQIGVREFAVRAGSERDLLMRNLVGVRLALTSMGVLLATAFAAVAGYGHAVVLGTLLAGIAMVLWVAQGSYATPLAAQLQLGRVTALELLRQALGVVGIVVLVLAGAKLLAFLAVLLPVALVVLGLTVALVHGSMPLRPAFQRSEWKALMLAVLPFAAAAVIGAFYLRITVVITSLLASAAQTGYYATSFVVVSVLVAVPALTVGSTLPVLARAARDDHDRLGYVLERLFEVTLIIGVWLGLALALGAGFVIDLLAKGSSPVSVDVLEIQSVALVTSFAASSWQYGLLSLHRHRELLWVTAISLAASVLLSLILIPSLQARGAAIAFSGAELAMAASSFAMLRLARPELRFSPRVPLCVLASACLGGAVLLIPGLGSLPRSLVGAGVYIAVLLALRAVPVELFEALGRRRRDP